MEFERVLREMLESYIRGIYTAIPATIVAFDNKNQRATVQIDILEQIGDKLEKIAPLQDVAVAFPRSGGFLITFPVNVGDKVQLIFQNRSIDKWLIDGNANQKDNRTHNINDAIASNLIAYPLNNTISDFDNDSVTIRNTSKSIFLKVKDDKIEIQGDVSIEGNMKVKGKIDATGHISSDTDCISSGISGKSHVHGGVKPGPSSTTPPQG